MATLASALTPFFVLWSVWLSVAVLSLHKLPQGDDRRNADVHIIIAARNEAQSLPATLAQLDGWPILVAEGPSEDETRALTPPNMLVALDAVPPGWVGKSHALWTAAQRVTAKWMVFLDADIRVAPGTIEAAVAHAEAHALNYLTLHPGQAARTFWGRAALLLIGQGMLVFSPPWMVRRGWASGGLGAFQLVRREAYLAAGGHAAIRTEILDDVALGRLLSPSDHLSATHLLAADWAQTAPEVVRAMTKNGFAVLGYRTWLAATSTAFFLAAWIAGAFGWLIGAPDATAAWMLLALPGLLQTILGRGFGPPPGRPRLRGVPAALAGPIAFLIFPAVFAWSAYQTRRHGIRWRGSRYLAPR